MVLYTDYESSGSTVKPSQQQQQQHAGLKKPPPTPGKAGNAASAAGGGSGGGETTLNEMRSILPAVLVSAETAKLLDQLGEGTIDEKLRRLFGDKQELKELNVKLTNELEEERDKRCELEKKLIAQAHKVLDSHESSQDLQDIQRELSIFSLPNDYTIKISFFFSLSLKVNTRRRSTS